MYLTLFTRQLPLIFALLLPAPTLLAAPHVLDRGNSAISLTFTLLGQELTAHFSRFNATIDFEEQHPARARIRIDLDVSSIDTGYPDYNQEIVSSTWLDTSQFPLSTFTSSALAVVPGKAGKHTRHDISGKLIIKGQAAKVHFPVNITRRDGQYVFDGTLPIRRLDYRVGEDVWHGTAMVADIVTIHFHLVTTPAQPAS